MTGHDVVDLAKKFEDYGVEAVIYTDIGRDGMLSGVNIEATVKLAQALRIPVIASGGIASIKDVKALCAVQGEGITGAITGKKAARSTKARWISRRPRLALQAGQARPLTGG
jgi:phosphoribosylformimino-5-aminoimidazole carboxamide ribotide isomerase